MPEISKAQLDFLRGVKKHKRIVAFLRAAILSVFLFAWELSSRTGFIDPFIFSSPSKIAVCFITMLKNHMLIKHISATLYETLASFFLVTLSGVSFAVLLWCDKKVSEILDPYLVVLNSLPKSALAPLLIVWLAATRATIIAAGMSVAVFGSIISLYTNFISIDKEKIKLIYTLGGNRRHALTKVILPGCVPSIISNMKVNVGLCLVGVVIGEFLAARTGLGYLIIYSSQVFKMDWLLMSVVLLCFMAMLLYSLISLAEKHVRK